MEPHVIEQPTPEGPRVVLARALLIAAMGALACGRAGGGTPPLRPGGADAHRQEGGESLLVAADPARGWHWPFRLYVPNGTGTLRLLVLPNNTGKVHDDLAVHDREAERLWRRNHKLARDFQLALLVPSFPRPEAHDRVYTHALDRDTMLAKVPLGALDRQLLAMIDAANAELQGRRRGRCARVFLIGFSAAGMFVSRFSLLHPERVQAAVGGSPGGWPMVPATSDGGEQLTYPLGTADFRTIAGRPFPREEARRLPLLFLLGDQDVNDAVPYPDAFDKAHAELVTRRFGKTLVERWPHARRLFSGFNADFRLYAGVGHSWSREMILDILAFLRRHDERSACVR
jgi:dienelactone hydrolase